jgi:GNAT superfamily N-acetyltransferase
MSLSIVLLFFYSLSFFSNIDVWEERMSEKKFKANVDDVVIRHVERRDEEACRILIEGEMLNSANSRRRPQVDGYIQKQRKKDLGHLYDHYGSHVDHRCLLVAEIEGVIAGCGAVELFDDGFELRRLYISSHRKGRGIGSKLLNSIELFCIEDGKRNEKNKGEKEIALRTHTTEDLPDALPFYLKRGFKVEKKTGKFFVLYHLLKMLPIVAERGKEEEREEECVEIKNERSKVEDESERVVKRPKMSDE